MQFAISKQLLDDSGPNIGDYIDGLLSGRITPLPSPPEPCRAPVLQGRVVLLHVGEADLLTERCQCAHLEVLHNRDSEYGDDDCRMCECSEYRPR